MKASKQSSVAQPDRRSLAAVAAALALGWSPAALAQQDFEDEDAAAARPVVQSTAGTARLSGALGRLARNPRDLAALVDAGQAALEMNDIDAAIGFFRRADGILPGNSVVKAGLGGALVRKLDPFAAIPLFEDAARSGTLGANALADRGLAYDLVGDAIGAQRYYRQALTAGHNDETVRRLALSQAIDGDRTGMEATLSPLLQRQDRMAWRTRAFALAVLGRGEEAESIARSTMRADLAVAMSAYLRYMPRLTRAQQAAAGDLGFFPRAADIGRDDPRVGQFMGQRPELAAANQSLTPAGRPLGRDTKAKDKAEDREKDRDREKRDAKAKPVVLAAVAPPEIRPAREEVVLRPVPVAQPPVKIAIATPTPSPTPPARVFATLAPTPAPTPVQVDARVPARPAITTGPFDLAQLARPAVAPTPTPSPTPAPPPTTVPAKPRNLAEAFADLTAPSSEGAAKSGAVDVTRLLASGAKAAAPGTKTAAKPTAAEAAKTKAETEKKVKAEAEKKAKAEADKLAKANPARIWVQVRTGRDTKALGFDWRKLVKDDPATFKGKVPFVAEWGATNRLVTGPFATDKAASAFVADLKKAGVGGAFLFRSDAGETVDPLGSK